MTKHTTMQVDFTRFDAEDKEQVTIWAFHLGNHIASDMAAHGRIFRISSYTSDIASAYQMSNKEALRRGRVIGGKLVRGEELNTGDSLISGGDLARSIAYVLNNDGSYQWGAVRKYVRSLGGIWNDLIDDLDDSDQGPVGHVLTSELAKISTDTLSVAAELRRIANIIEPMEREMKRLSTKVERQNLTILNTTNANTELIDRSNKIKALLTRMLDQIDKEPNGDAKRKIEVAYRDFKNKFEQLLD